MSQLIRLADKKLPANRKAENEEDIVQQAFAQFFIQVQNGRFSKLDDRDDLWKVLAMLVDRRVTDLHRRRMSQKAGQGGIHTESIFFKQSELGGIDRMPALDPTPDLAIEFRDMLRNRLQDMDEEYTRIALMKLEGYSNQEIANRLDCKLRTVERRLQKIRQRWDPDSTDESR